jgi:methionyl-tRNA synthetase
MVQTWLRHFLREIEFDEMHDFNEERFVAITADLANSLGNLLNCSASVW